MYFREIMGTVKMCTLSKSLIPECDNPVSHAYLGIRKRDDECEPEYR